MKLNTIMNYLGWASGIFGALLMLLGVIGFFTGSELLGVKNFYNSFFIANSFLFLGIFLLIGTRCCCCCCKDDKCCTEGEKK
jgi:multisubunit Na+/H+ antiporter MnhG subunit